MEYNSGPSLFSRIYWWPARDQISALLGCYSVCSGKSLPRFRDNQSMPYISWPLKMLLITCTETSVRICHYTLCNNQEESSSRLHGGGNPKSRLAKVPSNNSHCRPLIDGFLVLCLSFMLPVAKSFSFHCRCVCFVGLLDRLLLEIATNLVWCVPCFWTSMIPDGSVWVWNLVADTEGRK